MNNENNSIKINNNGYHNDNFLNRQHMLDDIIYFKNDILTEIKEIKDKLKEQNNIINNEVNKKLILYNGKIEDLQSRVNDFSAILNKRAAELSYYTEKLNTLIEFKNNVEQEKINKDYKFKLFTDELKNAINKYDKLISNNLIYPGIIGIDSKFKDYHEFVDYVLKQIEIFTAFKDKNIFDLKTYKTKLESNMKSLHLQTQSILNSAKAYTMKNIKDSEEKCFNEIKLYDEKIMRTKMDNFSYINKLEIQNKEILEEFSKIMIMKKNLTDIVEKSVEDTKRSNENTQKLFQDYQEQFNEIKNNYNLLTYFIIEILNNYSPKSTNNSNSHINSNINTNVNISPKREKNEFKNKVEEKEEKKQYEPLMKKVENVLKKNKIKNYKLKRIKSAESLLKNYINGKTTLEELLEKTTKKIHKDNKNNKDSILNRIVYDDDPITIIHLLTLKKNRYRTIDDNSKSQNNLSFQEKNKTDNNSPKSIYITKSEEKENKIKSLDIDGIRTDNNFIELKKNISHKIKDIGGKKILLIRDGNSSVYNYNLNFRIKTKEKKTKNTLSNKDREKEKDNENNEIINEINNLKQLKEINFLIINKNNKNKFPKIKDIKVKENEPKEIKEIKRFKIRKRNSKINNKFDCNNNSFKYQNMNDGIRKKNKSRIMSSEIIMNHNINKNFNHMNHSVNNEFMDSISQKYSEKLKKKSNKLEFYSKGKYDTIKAEKNK